MKQSDRERFEEFSRKNGLKMPRGLTGKTSKEVRNAVDKIGFPVLIRPSYVLVEEVWKYLLMISNLMLTLAKLYHS